MAGRSKVLASPSHCPSLINPCVRREAKEGLLTSHRESSCFPLGKLGSVYFHFDFYLDFPSPSLLSGVPTPRNCCLLWGLVSPIGSVSENQPLSWHDRNLPQRPAGSESQPHAETLSHRVQLLPPHLVSPRRVSEPSPRAETC